MEETEKIDFCRMLGTLRAMYPNEYNMSELVPVAYWVACRGTSLAAVKKAMVRLIRSPEWLRDMPPAPVLAEQARLIERREKAIQISHSQTTSSQDRGTPQSAAWVNAARNLTEKYCQEGLDRGAATLRAVRQMLEQK